MSDYTPLRSVLYMPSSNAKALEKAKTLPADGIIFDLEDAVAPDAKPAAREAACAAAGLASGATASSRSRISASQAMVLAFSSARSLDDGM